MLNKLTAFVRSPEVQFAIFAIELTVLVVREIANYAHQESPSLPPRR